MDAFHAVDYKNRHETHLLLIYNYFSLARLVIISLPLLHLSPSPRRLFLLLSISGAHAPQSLSASRKNLIQIGSFLSFAFVCCSVFCFFYVCVAAALNDATFCFSPIIYAPRIVSETTISGNEKILSRDRPQHNNKKLLTSDAGNVTLQQMGCLILLFCKNGNNCNSLRF